MKCGTPDRGTLWPTFRQNFSPYERNCWCPRLSDDPLCSVRMCSSSARERVPTAFLNQTVVRVTFNRYIEQDLSRLHVCILVTDNWVFVEWNLYISFLLDIDSCIVYDYFVKFLMFYEVFRSISLERFKFKSIHQTVRTICYCKPNYEYQQPTRSCSIHFWKLLEYV